MNFFRKRTLNTLVRRADKAMARRDWTEAAYAYAKIIKSQPLASAFHVQHGHARKELGDLADAETSYRRAIEITPDDTETMLHLAHLLKRQERKPESMQCFAEILRRDPANREAYAELIHGGARNLLPTEFRRETRSTILSGLGAALQTTIAAVEDWRDAATYPVIRYDAFRHDFPIKPPPGAIDGPTISVVIDAQDTTPSFLRSTLLSLIDQADDGWRAVIVGTKDILAHSVASISAVDDRFLFVTDWAFTTGSDHRLHISAGTILDRNALTWFSFTAKRTGSMAIWCDHDYAVENWRDRLRYESPQLWGVMDRDFLAQVVNPPAAVLLHPSVIAAESVSGDAERRRTSLLRAAARRSTAHIPRLLASVLRLPERAGIAPTGDDFPHLWSSDPRGSPPRPGPVQDVPLVIVNRGQRPSVAIAPVVKPGEYIHIIIPTRDESRMLESAVETLLNKALHRDFITITIVDNRSVEPETFAAFRRLKTIKGVDVLSLDEPFNWPRANNVAAARSSAENIVFANNDIEMLTTGWDDILLGFLQRDDVGLVGTRLLYPDGKLQHAAMVFGIGEGSPIHDGLNVESDVAGPQERFDLTHAAVAVTGAFMAMTRAMFTQVGGFDELALPIGYNDIDMCLRVRAAGRHVLYTPAIELIHHESKTRGFNTTRARVAWDQGELATMHRRWGSFLTDDPGYNLHWSRQHLYDGFRDPSMREILGHIDLSATADPWHVDPTASGEH